MDPEREFEGLGAPDEILEVKTLRIDRRNRQLEWEESSAAVFASK